MKKHLVVLISCCLVLTAVSPLSQASNQPTAAIRRNSQPATTQPTRPQPVVKNLQPKHQEPGDLSTLAGSGEAKSGTATAIPRREINEKAISTTPPEISPERRRLLEELEEEDEPAPPIAEGPKAPPASIPAPTEGARAGIANSSSAAPAPLAPNDMTYFESHNLTSSEAPLSLRSSTHEPSTINLDSAVLYTANWYAAKSVSGGSSFTFIDPFTFFPSANGGFCCDQQTAYAPNQDMALWSLQYVKDTSSGTLRIARAVGSAGINNNGWVFWDFTPQNVGFASGNWFDFPSMVVAGNYLYVSSNVHRTSDDSFNGSVLLRIPLSNLAAGTAFNYDFFTSSLFTLRPTEGAGTTMYFMAFLNSTQMRVHRWAESGNSILWDDVSLNSFTFLSSGTGVATSPDGTNWAGRAQTKVLAAYVAKGVIGAMFPARQDATFPFPYTIHVRFNESTRALITQGAIWNQNYAWLYPSAMPNARGDLAGTLQLGGGSASSGFPFPGTQVWVSDDIQPGNSTVGGFYNLGDSNAGPSSNRWGDYLTTHLHKIHNNTWVAASFTLQGGQTGQSVVPRYTWFGRERDRSGGVVCATQPISFGQTVNSTISGTDCQRGSGQFYDDYTFNGTAGQQVVISMSSPDFDTYLLLLSGGGQTLAEDDDGGGGTNSRIPATSGSFTLPSTGTYVIRASTFSASATGGYSLSLTLGSSSTSGLQYYALPSPVRLLDTRSGQSACDTPGTPLTPNVARTEAARITCTGIPSTAQAVVGNATVVNNTGAGGGFVTLYPSGATRPNVSNLNYVAAQVVPNAFTVGLGTDGAFNIYATSGINFIVDVTGYYAPPGTGGLYYHALPSPVRLLDTRSGQSACDTPGTPLTPNVARTEAARIACTGIPSTAQAVVGNATVVNNTGAGGGFVTLYPSGATRPNVSNLNYVAAQVVPNAFTVGLGTDGAFNIFATSGINFIVDVTGYFSNQQTDANGTGLLFTSLASPVRLLDTRSGQSACDTPGTPLTPNVARTEAARIPCTGIPSSAQVVVGNATVVNNTGAGGGFVTLYPSSAARPNVSNLNYVAEQVVPNAFTVGLGGDGAFNIFATSGINFIADASGYFAP